MERRNCLVVIIPHAATRPERGAISTSSPRQATGRTAGGRATPRACVRRRGNILSFPASRASVGSSYILLPPPWCMHAYLDRSLVPSAQVRRAVARRPAGPQSPSPSSSSAFGPSCRPPAPACPKSHLSRPSLSLWGNLVPLHCWGGKAGRRRGKQEKRAGAGAGGCSGRERPMQRRKQRRVMCAGPG